MPATFSDTTTTRADGVRVDKGIEAGDGRLRVHYRVRNERAADAAVRITEALDAAFPLDALDLAAGGGAGDWLLDSADGRVVLAEFVPAEDAVTTGYVVHREDADSVEAILDAPTIDAVDPVDDGDDDAATEGATPSSERADGDAEAATTPTPIVAPSGEPAADAASAVDPAAVAEAMDAQAVAAALDTDVLVAELRERLDGDAPRTERLDGDAPQTERLDALEAEVEALRARLRTFERCCEDSLTDVADAVAALEAEATPDADPPYGGVDDGPTRTPAAAGRDSIFHAGEDGTDD